jgi:hypothetical protein
MFIPVHKEYILFLKYKKNFSWKILFELLSHYEFIINAHYFYYLLLI